MEIFTQSGLLTLAEILMINIVLSGDNAVVIGMVAARVAPALRGRIIMWGLAAAVVLRIVFSIVAVYLLNIIGLTLAGGILLLWVSWRLYRDITEHKAEDEGADIVASEHPDSETSHAEGVPLKRAIFQIIVADVSMSLDNVLAVAGAAKDHLELLIVGLVLSIALMGVAATFIAKALQRYPWLSYVGLVLIVYVAIEMIWHGGWEVMEVVKV